MELKVIGTGSSGNCYILENANSALIIEAGVSFKEVKKALGFDITKIVGVLISHSHKDHSKYIKDYQKAGINVYMSLETFKESNLNELFTPIITPLKSFEIGEFKIMAFDLVHDVFCLGFQIEHIECGKIIFITDTKYSPYTFANVDCWLIECNNSEGILEEKIIRDEIHPSLMDRITENHISLETLIEIFDSNDMKSTRNIILLHGSDSNSHSEHFKKEVISRTGKPTCIAKKGLKLNLNKL